MPLQKAINFNRKKNVEKFKNACKPIKNIDIDEIINELYAERRKGEPSF